MVVSGNPDLEEAVRAELETVLATPSFRNAPGLSNFLRYVVERSIEGRARELKEYSIAVEALGRNPAFEPRTDTIVRVQARRVRERLAAYYAEGGRDAKLRIELPVGTYVPDFAYGTKNGARSPEADSPALRTQGVSGDQSDRSKGSRLWRAGRWLAGMLALVAAVALFQGAFRPNEPPLALVAEPLTYYEGNESEASFSPDGNQIVFSWDRGEEQNPELFVQTVGGSDPLRLTDDPGREFSPAWSPDGQWVAFLRRNLDGGIAAIRMPALGGREESLLELSLPGGTGVARSVRRRYVDWSPDSRFLALVDQQPEDVSPSLYLYSMDDGTRRRLTRAPADGLGDQNPTFSPDGSALVFSGSRDGRSGLLALELGAGYTPSGQPQYIPFPDGRTFGPAWFNMDWVNNEEVLVHAGVRFWRANVADGMVRPADTGGGRGSFPSVSVPSQRLAYTNSLYEANIWRIDLDEDRAGSNPTRVIASTGYNVNFHVSPGADQIVFQSTRDDKHSMWIADLRGGEPPAPLTSRKGGSPRWSPDGGTIVFDAPSDPANRALFDIWSIKPGGGAARKLTTSTADDRLPSWSRDGEWVYFSSDRGDGYQVWKRHLVTGEEHQITQDGGRAAIEGANGFVYYVKAPSDYSVWRVPVEGGTEVKVLDALLSFNPLTASAAGVYYMPGDRSGGPNTIMFYDFEDGSKRVVYRSKKTLSSGLAVTGDERTLYFSQVDASGSDLMIVEGFR